MWRCLEVLRSWGQSPYEWYQCPYMGLWKLPYPLLPCEVSAKTWPSGKQALTTHWLHWHHDCIPWYLPRWVENLRSHRNLHVDVWSSFIHNCQNLDATKMYFNRWMDKLWYIQTMEYYSTLNRAMNRHAGKLNAYFSLPVLMVIRGSNLYIVSVTDVKD